MKRVVHYWFIIIISIRLLSFIMNENVKFKWFVVVGCITMAIYSSQWFAKHPWLDPGAIQQPTYTYYGKR